MNNSIKSILTAFFLIPLLSFGQTYTSDIQMDLTSSGNKKVGYDKATLVFSKANGEFSIKFDKLKSTEKYKISFMDKKDNGDHIQTMYTIEGNTNYGGLKISEYDTPIKVDGSSYPLSFTIIGMNAYGQIAYYTTFYAKK